MKSLLSVSKFVLLLACVTVSFNAKAHTPSFACYITNEVLVSPTEYQFDIFLLKTGNAPFEYAAGQWGITVNADVTGGGTLTASIVAGSTMLTNKMQVNTTAMLPSQTFVFNVAAKAPPGTGHGSMITDVTGGCTSPGTKVVTFRITNSVPFAQNTRMNHVFNFTSEPGKIVTKVHAYVNGLNTDVTQFGTFYSYNTPGTCGQNIPINSVLSTVPNQTGAGTDMLVSVYPNPATTATMVSFISKGSLNYHLALVDMLGREVLTKEGVTVQGENFINLNLNGLAKGVYQVNLKSGDKSSVVRTVVE